MTEFSLWIGEKKEDRQPEHTKSGQQPRILYLLPLEMLTYGRPSMLRWVWRPHIPEHVEFPLSKYICLLLVCFLEFSFFLCASEKKKLKTHAA